MKRFKFLRNPLLVAHDGHEIYPSQFFYTMNKQDMDSLANPGRLIPKYTIVRRCIHPKFQDVFKPDHEALWYFGSKSNAEWLRDMWIRQDQQESITITFNPRMI